MHFRPVNLGKKGLLAISMNWSINKFNHDSAVRLAQDLNISPVLAGMLLRRGFADPIGARSFLQPTLSDLPDPGLLPDMEKAVDRLIKALNQNDFICVYGDYDADGLSASVLLADFLSELGGKVKIYIPNRVEEGYGLHVGAVETLAGDGVNVIVTVDCGISDADAVRRARELGLDVIITDHHQVPAAIPPALAVINPQRAESRFPQKRLAGVGVAFFLAGGLRQTLRKRGVLTNGHAPELAPHLGLVAIGTVADVVPLTKVNRILVSHGLQHLTAPIKPGLCALKEIGAIKPDCPVTSRDIAFRLAPRLNAPGRIGSPRPCLDLLRSTDLPQAQGHAQILEKCNRERRKIQDQIFKEAQLMLEDRPDGFNTILLVKEGWARGIVGLAASRLAESHRKPVVLLSLEDGLAVGSGRSVQGFNLFKALDSCRELMIKFGGHEQAAGLTVHPDKVMDLARSFEISAADDMGALDPTPVLDVECEVKIADLITGLPAQIPLLAPFGEGNPEPVFALQGATVNSACCIGADSKHLRLNVAQNGCAVDLIGFGHGHRLPELGRKVNVAVQQHVSTYQGRLNMGWKIVDIERSSKSTAL